MNVDIVLLLLVALRSIKAILEHHEAVQEEEDRVIKDVCRDVLITPMRSNPRKTIVRP